MSDSPSKRMALLAAYEELTRKEALCLREENHEAVLETQEKKAALLRGLEAMMDGPFEAGERDAFSERLKAVRQQEDQNAALLADQMQANREQRRELGQKSKAASHLIKAYGSPSGSSSADESSLSDHV